MSNVIIYTTPTCVFCDKAKEFFKANKVKYKSIDVTENPAKAQEMIDKSGQMGVPVIEIDEEIVIGFDEARLKKLLKIK